MTVEIINGDCLEVIAALIERGVRVDAVIMDPPYFLPAEHYKTRTKWARSLSDLSIIEHFVGEVFKLARQILKPEGAMLVFCDGQSYPVFYVKAYRIFDRLTDIVWDKGVIGMGQGVRRQHELILGCLPASFEWNGWARSVITCPPVPSEDRDHPAQKPVELLRQFVRLITPEGGTVLDPFCGSASTGEACVYEGRSFIGIEREADYKAIGDARLLRAQGVAADIPRFNPKHREEPLFA